MQKFFNSSIYKLQDDAKTFTDVGEFLKSLDPKLLKASQRSLRSLLKEEKFSDELCQFGSAACLVNYNQSIDIQGFVGLVSLAGADANLWNVRSRSGNKEIPENLLKLSGATLYSNATVIEVKPYNEKTTITYISNNVECTKSYDYVVLAFPLTKNLDNFTLGFDFDPKNYEMQLTKAYFIEGNVSLFPNIPLDRRNELICCDDSLDFRSVSVQLPCDYTDKADSKLWLDDKKKLYKVFSKVDLDEKVLRKIFFDDYKIVKKIDWYAYPKYEVLSNDQHFPPVIIDSKERSRVYYLNSFEWSASCMEMSCISARNIALLISKQEQSVEKTLKSNTKFTKKSNFKSILVLSAIFGFIFSFLYQKY